MTQQPDHIASTATARSFVSGGQGASVRRQLERGRDPPHDGSSSRGPLRAQAVVRAFEPHVAHRPGDRGRRNFELAGGGERVPRPRDEEARDTELGEVGDALAFGSPRRMERIADQREAGGGESLSDHLGADPASHGPSPEDQCVGSGAELSGEVGGPFSDGRLEDGGGVGAPASSQTVGEVHALDRETARLEQRRELDQCRALGAPAGPGSEEDAGQGPGPVVLRPRTADRHGWHGTASRRMQRGFEKGSVFG